MLTVMVT